MSLIGTSLGPYKIIEELGSGATGVVYRAMDTRLDRAVALKMIRDDLSSSEKYYRLLTVEAKAAARIDSPNVVRIWDHGQIDGRLYITSELVDGPDLRSIADILSFEQKIDIARQLARGVMAAHAVGLIHRDLKPENIKITSGGTVKILDFGLAKSVSESTLQSTMRQQTETATGQYFVGTIYYASPEQLSGDVLSPASDIFSIGVILYELFTGIRPFEAGHLSRVIYAILNEDPVAPKTRCPEVPLWLDQAILHALTKSQQARIRSAQELLDALTEPSDPAVFASTTPLIRPRQTVTVVDLRNLSGDPSWDYFVQGFTEEVTREISRHTDMVIASQPAGCDPRDIKDLIGRCRTDFVLTGSLFKWQNRIRMTLDLHRSRDYKLVAGESYEGNSDALFSLLSQAASNVATVLSLETGYSTVEVHDPLQMNIGAYEYYLKGRSYYQTTRPEDSEFAEMMFRRALEIDPSLAFAHAGLSDLYNFQYMFYYDRTPARIEAARQEALKAIEIAPMLAEGHRSLGRYYQVVGDYHTAELSIRKAIDCNPKFALAYRSMAWLREIQGDHEGAMKWAKKALELSPLDTEVMLLIGLLYMDTRKFALAISTFQRAIELSPDYGRAYHELGTVYLKIGALDEALNSFELAAKYKGDPNAHIQAGYVHLIRREYAQAEAKFKESIEGKFFPFVATYYLGLARMLQGDIAQAYELFQRSINLEPPTNLGTVADLSVLGYHAMSLAGLGRADDACEVLSQMIARESELDGEHFNCMARAWALLGNASKSLELGKRAVGSHAGPTETELRLDPHFSLTSSD